MHERSPEYSEGEGQSTLPHRPLPAPAAPEPLTQESTHTRQLDSLALATTPRRRVGELFEHVWVNYLTRDIRVQRYANTCWYRKSIANCCRAICQAPLPSNPVHNVVGGVCTCRRL